MGQKATVINIFDRSVPLLGFGCMRLPETQDGEYVTKECEFNPGYESR